MTLSRRLSILAFLFIWAFSACNTPSDMLTQTPSESMTDVPATATLTQSPTPEPVQAITICTAEIPDDLFLYSGQSSEARSAVLAMIQDALLDEGGGILSELPDEVNGGLFLQPVSVQSGQTVVDANGELVVLKAGVTVRPSGCRESSCTVNWDGESDLQMDQMVLTFHLVEGLSWSDGTAVTAKDSVFNFQLASDPIVPGLKWAENRTASYSATDERTVTWLGKPGFTSPDPEAFFWAPLPSHAVNSEEEISVVSGLPAFSTLPLSYGPFSIVSLSEEAIQLAQNPYYYRKDEGLPVIDEITILAIGDDRTAAVRALEDGTCDVLDASFGLENDLQAVASLQADDGYKVLINPGSSWVQLVFGIRPASYDDYFNPLNGDRPNYFGDERVRQAIATCLDKDAMMRTGLSAVTEMWSSFVPANESQLAQEMGYDYDPSSAITLLESAGWRDHDLDAETPLQAWEVAGVPTGTDFSVTLLTDTSIMQQNLAGIVQESLGQCGIDVTVTSLPASELYAPGPDGVVFGRQFDLTFIAWQAMPDLDCAFYQSWQIPSDENLWVGTNIAGLWDDSFDQACSTAALALPAEYADSLLLAEEVFLETLAAIPLFSIPRVIVVPSEGCSKESVSTGDDFFNLLEYYEVSGNCP